MQSDLSEKLGSEGAQKSVIVLCISHCDAQVISTACLGHEIFNEQTVIDHQCFQQSLGRNAVRCFHHHEICLRRDHTQTRYLCKLALKSRSFGSEFYESFSVIFFVFLDIIQKDFYLVAYYYKVMDFLK